MLTNDLAITGLLAFSIQEARQEHRPELAQTAKNLMNNCNNTDSLDRVMLLNDMKAALEEGAKLFADAAQEVAKLVEAEKAPKVFTLQ